MHTNGSGSTVQTPLSLGAGLTMTLQKNEGGFTFIDLLPGSRDRRIRVWINQALVAPSPAGDVVTFPVKGARIIRKESTGTLVMKPDPKCSVAYLVVPPQETVSTQTDQIDSEVEVAASASMYDSGPEVTSWALVNSSHREPEGHAMPQDTDLLPQIECPHCAELILAKATRCRFCKGLVKKTPREQTDTRPKTECPYCGEIVLTRATRCRHCKGWLTEATLTTKACPSCDSAMPVFFLPSSLSVGDTFLRRCSTCGKDVEFTATRKRFW